MAQENTAAAPKAGKDIHIRDLILQGIFGGLAIIVVFVFIGNRLGLVYSAYSDHGSHGAHGEAHGEDHSKDGAKAAPAAKDDTKKADAPEGDAKKDDH